MKVNNECIICGSDTIEIIDKKGTFSYFKCENCDFIYKNRKHIVSKEEEKARYDEHNNNFEDPKYIEYFEDFINKSILPFIGSGKDSLDFGSGPVPVLGKILSEKYCFNVDLYDYYYSPEKIYLDKQYDLITCTEVIEHIGNPLEYFKIFKRLLKTNGILAMMTYFHPKDEDIFLNWHYIRDKTHISFFSEKTFNFISKELGLELKYSDCKKMVVLKKE